MSTEIPVLGGANQATATLNFDDDEQVTTTTNLHGRAGRATVHIRIQQRSGRKTLTTVQGLPKDLDPKKILKVFKKEFACNGCVVEDEEMGEVIQLQGDHRAKISSLLIEEGICKKDEVHIHGF